MPGFGDEGNHVVNVRGVPFRVFAADEAEAADIVLRKINSTLTPQGNSLLLYDQASKHDINLGNVPEDIAIAQRNREEARQAGPLDRAVLGAERRVTQIKRGFAQLAAELIGEDEAADELAFLQKQDDELFRFMDERGVADEVGSVIPDVLAFTSVSLLGGGLLALAAGGALLAGGGHVQEAGSDATGRLGDAARGAVGAVILPAGGNILAGLGRGIGRLAGAAGNLSVNVAKGARLHLHNLLGRPGATRRVVTQAFDPLEDVTAAGTRSSMEQLQRAALTKVQQIIGGLPRSLSKGLRDEATMGAVDSSLAAATRTTATGTNVFNPAAWEKSIQSILPKMRTMFSGPKGRILPDSQAHFQALQSVNTLAKAMQEIPEGLVTAQSARLASEALISAPAKAEPILRALALATKRDSQVTLFNALVQLGSSVSRAAATGTAAGVGESIAARGGDDISIQSIAEGVAGIQ